MKIELEMTDWHGLNESVASEMLKVFDERRESYRASLKEYEYSYITPPASETERTKNEIKEEIWGHLKPWISNRQRLNLVLDTDSKTLQVVARNSEQHNEVLDC